MAQQAWMDNLQRLAAQRAATQGGQVPGGVSGGSPPTALNNEPSYEIKIKGNMPNRPQQPPQMNRGMGGMGGPGGPGGPGGMGQMDPRMLMMLKRRAAQQMAMMQANPQMQRNMGAAAGRMPMDPNAGYQNLHASATQPGMSQGNRNAALDNFIGNVTRGMRS